MRVVVTRVQLQATVWAQAMVENGYQVLMLPLIDIAALPDTKALTQAWQEWPTYHAVMFVSASAVHYFFASKPAITPYPYTKYAIKTRVWVTGPGTRSAVLAQGILAQQIDAPELTHQQFDSEALWQQVHHTIHRGDRVLIVRGAKRSPDSGAARSQGRDWLAQQVQALGAQVQCVAAYVRLLPQWSMSQCEQARQAASDGSVWLLGSVEAVGNLQTLLWQQNWTQAQAVVTHPRIASAARSLGFGKVTSSAACLSAVLTSVESLS